MRLQLTAVLLAVTTAVSQAQLIPLFQGRLFGQADQNQMQAPVAATTPSSTVLLSDVLGTQRSISIFSSLTRDVDDVSTRLENQSANTTLLAPLNSVLSALPRKPWEDPKDYAELGTNAYAGNQGSDRAAKNLERFVEAHVVPQSPWREGDKVKSLAGEELWWEDKDGSTYIMPGKIEVERKAKEVGNGEVWILQKVINYT